MPLLKGEAFALKNFYIIIIKFPHFSPPKKSTKLALIFKFLCIYNKQI